MKDYSSPAYTLEYSADVPTEWNVLAGANVLHTHLFNTTVLDAGVERAWFQFVTLREGQRCVATASLSAFDIDLGLFLGKSAEAWLLRIRRFSPRFLKINILICGLPASFGQSNLAFSPDADRETCLRLLAHYMEEVALKKGIKYLCFKEFDRSEAETLRPLETLGYFKAYSLPDTHLDLSHWAGTADYLAGMRSHYRRKIKLSLKKIGLRRPEIHPFSAELAAGREPVLLFGGDETCPPEQFYRMYLSVMDRAETKLETLNLAFFEQLCANYPDQLVVLALWQGGQVQGAVLLLPSGSTLIWLLVGIGEGRDTRFDTYFNLSLGLVEYAFAHGFQRIKTGQTAYPFKFRLGVHPDELFLFFRAKNRAKHFLLNKLRGVVFPKTPLPNLHVFK